MAKVQIKSEKLTPLGGIFSVMEQFDSTLSSANSVITSGADCYVSLRMTTLVMLDSKYAPF